MTPKTRRIALAAAAVLGLVVIGAGSILAVGYLLPSPPQRPVSVLPTPTATASPALPSPSPTISATPTPQPTAVPTPAPTPTPVSVVKALSCTIAISGGGSGSGGFITFPSGQFRADPASRVTTPDGDFWGLAHILATGRWVPVPRDWVAPDGLRYAYTTYGGGVRVVGADGTNWVVATGGTANTASGPRVAMSWRVLSSEADGIYVVPAQDGFSGLYRVGYGGGVTQVAGDGYWHAVGYGYAYGTITSWVPSGAANTVVRLDLKTGARSDYYTATSLTSRVVGFAVDGSPVVFGTGPQSVQVSLLTGPNRAVTLLSGAPPSGPAQGMWLNSALGDSHGVWLATNQGLFLYTSAAGTELASPVAGQLGSTCR